MSTDQSKIADTIGKLLSLAEDESATENEAQVARKKAERLMEKHSLTRDEVAKAEYEVFRWEHSYYSNCPGWYKTMAHSAARFVGLWAGYMTGRGDRNAGFVLGGRERDFQLWEHIVESIDNQIDLLVEQYKDEHPEAGRSDTNAYRLGVAQRVHERLTRIVREVSSNQRERNSNALVLKDEVEQRRQRGREAVVEGTDLKIGSGSRTQHSSNKGYRAGKRDGDKVNVHKGASSGRGERRLSS